MIDDSGLPVVTICSFSPQLAVISSKQRPRKLTIHGSDGEDYAFLLKGHEDLRQDERVMQVFHLYKWGSACFRASSIVFAATSVILRIIPVFLGARDFIVSHLPLDLYAKYNLEPGTFIPQSYLYMIKTIITRI